MSKISAILGAIVALPSPSRRLEGGRGEPGLAGRQEIAVGEMVEHAPGLPEPVGHVAGHG